MAGGGLGGLQKIFLGTPVLETRPVNWALNPVREGGENAHGMGQPLVFGWVFSKASPAQEES